MRPVSVAILPGLPGRPQVSQLASKAMFFLDSDIVLQASI